METRFDELRLPECPNEYGRYDLNGSGGIDADEAQDLENNELVILLNESSEIEGSNVDAFFASLPHSRIVDLITRQGSGCEEILQSGLFRELSRRDPIKTAAVLDGILDSPVPEEGADALMIEVVDFNQWPQIFDALRPLQPAYVASRESLRYEGDVIAADANGDHLLTKEEIEALTSTPFGLDWSWLKGAVENYHQPELTEIIREITEVWIDSEGQSVAALYLNGDLSSTVQSFILGSILVSAAASCGSDSGQRFMEFQMVADGEGFSRSGDILARNAVPVIKKIKEGKEISEGEKRTVRAALLLLHSAKNIVDEAEPQIFYFEMIIPEENIPEESIPSEPAPKMGKEI